MRPSPSTSRDPAPAPADGAAPRDAAPEEPLGRLQRVLGDYGERRTGPLLIVFGGVHGNEPAGVRALRRVLADLGRERPAIHGRMVAMAGNIGALTRGQRYLETDLNRMWSASAVSQLLGHGPDADAPEQREQRELLRAVAAELESPSRRVVFLDLHSTSAGGPPFSLMSDTLENRRVAMALPIPMILGLEETVSNTTLEYFGEQGFVSVGVEGGQHDDPATVGNHEAVIWHALVAAGMLRPAQVPRWAEHRARLRAAGGHLPRVVEILRRHGLRPHDGFRMEPGFSNFQPIRRGQLLARDDRGELRACHDGMIVLPSYQGLGDDGYFEGRTVGTAWFLVSGWLRRLRLGRLFHLLPGVEHHPARPNALVVDPRVARWRVVEIFHLFGFRRSRPEGNRLVFTRRPHGRWN